MKKIKIDNLLEGCSIFLDNRRRKIRHIKIHTPNDSKNLKIKKKR